MAHSNLRDLYRNDIVSIGLILYESLPPLLCKTLHSDLILRKKQFSEIFCNFNLKEETIFCKFTAPFVQTLLKQIAPGTRRFTTPQPLIISVGLASSKVTSLVCDWLTSILFGLGRLVVMVIMIDGSVKHTSEFARY